MNKISNFEGDNDHVDEELESSGEKDHHKETYNDDMEDSYLDSMDLRQEDQLIQTYNDVTIGRQHESYSNLEKKVESINSNSIIKKHNPFQPQIAEKDVNLFTHSNKMDFSDKSMKNFT